MINIPIYMNPLWNKNFENEFFNAVGSSTTPLDMEGAYYGPRASWFFPLILKKLNLKREDQIAILTTSDDIYVSICVSIPCFNYATISRIVTEKTKVIVLIHEYGYIKNNINELVQHWKSKGIIIIEDCAHIAGEGGGRQVGGYGDYVLYSLTKVIPGEAGGMLITKEKFMLPPMTLEEQEKTSKGMKAVERFWSIEGIKWFNKRRLQRYEMICNCSSIACFRPSDFACPYFIGIWTEFKESFLKENPKVEVGATLNSRKLYIPTNPLVPMEEFAAVKQWILKANDKQ